ncbi:MAG: hypothetical protein KF914_01390 [Rhizobiaceae bacterium]|nr:hypothetical protein [Rhizobiaceae bacterium]
MRLFAGRACLMALALLPCPALAEGLLGTGQATAAAGAPPSVAAEPGTPLAVVKPFYDAFGLERDPAQRGSFTDPARTVLDKADALAHAGEGQCLDENMALDNAEANAAQIRSSLRMGQSQKGDEARVVVAFTVDDVAHRLEWKLRKIDGAWKISDLLSVTGEWALSQYQCE